jgi:hypothetical protein
MLSSSLLDDPVDPITSSFNVITFTNPYLLAAKYHNPIPLPNPLMDF